jgi:hypothetical protein
VGDQRDLFPKDPNAIYDTDGDGIANAYDAFPNASSFSSWLGVAVWCLVILGLVAAGGLFINRRNQNEPDALIAAMFDAPVDTLKPMAPPPVQAFQQPLAPALVSLPPDPVMTPMHLFQGSSPQAPSMWNPRQRRLVLNLKAKRSKMSHPHRRAMNGLIWVRVGVER